MRPGDIPAKRAHDAAKQDAATRRRSGIVQRVGKGTVDVLPIGGNTVLQQVPLSGGAKAGDTVTLEFADGAYRAHGAAVTITPLPASGGGTVHFQVSGSLSGSLDGTLDVAAPITSTEGVIGLATGHGLAVTSGALVAEGLTGTADTLTLQADPATRSDNPSLNITTIATAGDHGTELLLTARVDSGPSAYVALDAWGGDTPGSKVELAAETILVGGPMASTVATGTAPLAVDSTTECTNLNAALLQGNAASAFATSGHTHAYLPLAGGTMAGDLVMGWGTVLALDTTDTATRRGSISPGRDGDDDFITSIFARANKGAHSASPYVGLWVSSVDGLKMAVYDGDVSLTYPFIVSKTGAMTIASTANVTNLSADTVDGSHASAFATSGHNHTGTYLAMSGGTLTGALGVTAGASVLTTLTNSTAPGTTGGGLIVFNTDDGSTLPSSGHRLGGFAAGGRTGASTITNSALVAAFAEENWGSTAAGTGISFQVTANTTTTRAEKMRLSNAGALTVTGAFGCNGKAAQTAYASGGALAAYGAGTNGFDTAAHASALHALVVAIRAALVANGLMS